MAQWWRAYNEALDDPKIQKLPLELFKAWFNLVCLASRNDGVLPCLEDIAFALRTNPQKADKILVGLINAKLFDATSDGVKPHNWSSRQYESDVSTPRVKRFRERRRNGKGNVPETEQSRAETDQNRADAPLSGFDASRETLAQAVWRLGECANAVKPGNVSCCAQWEADGVILEDVLAAVPKAKARARRQYGENWIGSPNYYTGAVMDEMRARKVQQSTNSELEQALAKVRQQHAAE